MILEIAPQSYVAWRTCITFFHAMAALSTLFRIKERYQSRQMWLDDYLVILPMTVIIVYCIIPWILPSVSPDPRTAQLSDYGNSWATFLFSFTIIWFSRICFMLSFARIFPPGRPSRARILFIAWFFAVLYCICMVLAALHCDPMDTSDRHCVVFVARHPAFIYVYIVDTVSTIVMVLCPLVVLWRIKLTKQETCITFAALSSSTMTLVVFGVLLIFIYAPFQRDSVSYLIVTCMLWNLMAAASLLSSNALVIVTTTFREYRRRQARSEAAELGREALKPKSELSSTRRTDPSQESGTSFELENTNQNTNHRTLASYTFYYIHSSRGRSAGSRSADRSPSQTPSPAYSLTDISMEEFDSQNRPPDLYYSSQLSDASFTPNQQCQQPAPLNHCPPHSSTQSARVV